MRFQKLHFTIPVSRTNHCESQPIQGFSKALCKLQQDKMIYFQVVGPYTSAEFFVVVAGFGFGYGQLSLRGIRYDNNVHLTKSATAGSTNNCEMCLN